MVSVWVDDDSSFGTFPLESMKCGVPVIGKIPKNEPDWLSENGMWTYDETKITEILGKFVMAWLEGVELTDEVIQKMKDTLLPYDSEISFLLIDLSLHEIAIVGLTDFSDGLKLSPIIGGAMYTTESVKYSVI